MAYGSRSKNYYWMGGSEAAPLHALLTLWNPKKSKTIKITTFNEQEINKLQSIKNRILFEKIIPDSA